MLKAFLSPTGRRRRLTYWRAAALIPLLGILGLIVATIVLRFFVRMSTDTPTAAVFTSAIATVVVLLFALWSGLVVAIQRLHDRDRSGWWVLIALVPVIGSIWYLFWNGLRAGTPGPNRFGSDPRAGDAALVEVFGDGPVPRRARKPIVSTLVAWAILLALLSVDALVLFQKPPRRAPPPAATPTQPIER